MRAFLLFIFFPLSLVPFFATRKRDIEAKAQPGLSVQPKRMTAAITVKHGLMERV